MNEKRQGERLLVIDAASEVGSQALLHLGDVAEVVPVYLPSGSTPAEGAASAGVEDLLQIRKAMAGGGSLLLSFSDATLISGDAERVVQQVVDGWAEANLRQVVLVSSGDVYAPARGAHNEGALVAPSGPRAEALVRCEELLRACAPDALTVLRAGVLYGPGCRGTVGLLCAVPVLLSQRMLMLPGFRGGPRWSFVHVADLVRAVRFVLADDRCAGGLYNVADPVPMALGEALTLATAAQELPMGPLVAWPPGVALNPLLPIVGHGTSLTLINQMAAFLWQRATQRVDDADALWPRLTRDLLPFVATDRILSAERLRVMGFVPQVDGLYQGLPEVVDDYRQRGWLPDLREVQRVESGLRLRYAMPMHGELLAAEGVGDGPLLPLTLDLSIDAPLWGLARGSEALVDGTLTLHETYPALLCEGTWQRKRDVFDVGFKSPTGESFRLWAAAEAGSDGRRYRVEIVDSRGQVCYRGGADRGGWRARAAMVRSARLGHVGL